MADFKVSVYIHGVVPQHLYGDCFSTLRANGIALLTLHKPGWASTTPEKVTLLKNMGRISGNRSSWMLVETIHYRDVTEDKLAWKKSEARREARILEQAAAEAAKAAAREELRRTSLARREAADKAFLAEFRNAFTAVSLAVQYGDITTAYHYASNMTPAPSAETLARVSEMTLIEAEEFFRATEKRI
jgi:hypothetical protein